MTALNTLDAITQRYGGSIIRQTQEQLSLEETLQRFEREATKLRAIVNSGDVMPNDCTRRQCWTFAARAKLAFREQSHRFNTLANLKTEWPVNWTNFVDLSCHIEGIMRELRETLEGVKA